MNRCTDPEYQDMLHAWELDMLSDQDRQRFELHLLQCEACAEEAVRFADAATLLRRDPEFRPSPDEMPTVEPPRGTGAWFTGKRITQSLLIAAVVLLVAVPVYRWTLAPTEQSAPVQHLNLAPVRTGEGNIVTREPGGTLEIRFYVHGASSARSYFVTVKSRHNEPVFQNDRFTGISNSGVGLLVLPMQDLDTGFYSLIVREVADTSSVLQEYNFRVE